MLVEQLIWPRWNLYSLVRERPLCKTVALYGLSGVGKTQLALKFAIEYQDRYNYIFFVNASSLEILRNDFIKLQKNLDLADGTGDAPRGDDKLAGFAE